MRMYEKMSRSWNRNPRRNTVSNHSYQLCTLAATRSNLITGVKRIISQSSQRLVLDSWNEHLQVRIDDAAEKNA